eukprot:jgi/Undpi1/10613/HiC_scaffold_29.g13063.m1
MINNRYRSLGLYFCAWAAARPALALLTTGVRCPVSALATPVMVVGTDKQAVHLPSGRFTACWPVGLGQYNGGPAVFLASKRRILDPREEVFPIPISDEVVSLLSEASESCAPLFGRDGGMYDNVPWEWSDDEMAKREAFNRSKGKGMMDLGATAKGQEPPAYGSAYGLLAEVATTLCPVDILSLFVEEEENTPAGVTLGASAYLRRRPKGDSLGGQRTIIEVTTDEAVGVALALGRQVFVNEDIWESSRIRPKFMMDGDKMRLDLNNLEGIEMFIDRERVAAPEQPPAWKIKSRGALARMSVEEKRGTLRASGVRPPRRRALSESEDKDRDLEDLVLPLMDEAVRRDVLLARAWRAGDFARAGELCAEKSERHIVAEQLQVAMKEGDEDLAKILMDRLEILESCRMDATQDVGSYQKDLDADEWYLKDRRSSLGFEG